MKFQTTVNIPGPKRKIGVRDSIFCIGSCFAEHISSFLKKHKFSVHSNPGGITYNPLTIVRWIEALCDDRPPSEEELFSHGGLYHHFQFHGKFSHPDKEAALKAMRESHQKGREQLLKADHLILTLGTAFTFVRQKSGEVVSNCHKLPADQFSRVWNSPAIIRDKLSSALEKLIKLNNNLHITATVSPVRHLRDGLVANNRSKAALLLSCHYLQEDFPEKIAYFPAYEILMDELRDYRFYAEDMAHPSSQAVRHVLEKFTNHFFSLEASQFCGEIAAIVTAAGHRPLHPGSEEHLRFAKNQLSKIHSLREKYPFADFEAEETAFRTQLEDK
jgi:hypothetical protein